MVTGGPGEATKQLAIGELQRLVGSTARGRRSQALSASIGAGEYLSNLLTSLNLPHLYKRCCAFPIPCFRWCYTELGTILAEVAWQRLSSRRVDCAASNYGSVQYGPHL